MKGRSGDWRDTAFEAPPDGVQVLVWSDTWGIELATYNKDRSESRGPANVLPNPTRYAEWEWTDNRGSVEGTRTIRWWSPLPAKPVPPEEFDPCI